jgi:hypothetical protein
MSVNCLLLFRKLSLKFRTFIKAPVMSLSGGTLVPFQVWNRLRFHDFNHKRESSAENRLHLILWFKELMISFISQLYINKIKKRSIKVMKIKVKTKILVDVIISSINYRCFSLANSVSSFCNKCFAFLFQVIACWSSLPHIFWEKFKTANSSLASYWISGLHTKAIKSICKSLNCAHEKGWEFLWTFHM